MPFTFVHPALVVPLLRIRRQPRWLSATGLLVGSIVPDFEKFFLLQLSSDHSHTLASLFYFNLPVGLALAFLFHLLVRQPLLAHLPQWLRRRVGHYAQFNWLLYFRHHYGAVLLSLLIGAAGHILWDNFTHPMYLTVKTMPYLLNRVQFAGRELPIYETIGLVSNVVGGLVTGWAIWRLPERAVRPVPPATMTTFWGIAVIVAGVLVIQWVLMANPRWLSIGLAGISGSMLGIVVASIYFRRLAAR